MTKSLHKKVGIASMIMMSSVLLSRVIGVFREMVIAYIGGATLEVDAYQVAFVIPEILNHIVASGFLSVTFIPIFTAYITQNDEEAGWRVFSLILTCVGSLLLLFIFLSFLFAPQVIDLVAPGRNDPVFKAIAVRMTRIIIPAQFFFFAGGLFMAVQFAKERFLVPALAPLLYNLGIVAGGLFMGTRIGMEGFSWGVLTGAFVGNFLLQCWAASRVGMRFRFTFDFRHPDLRKYIFLTLPLMLGLTMIFSMEIFIRYFGSYLSNGNIAALNYGRTILLIPVGLFGQAVGVASFPFMARLIAENKVQEMNQLLNRALRYLALVIPFSVLLMVLRHEVVQLLFQRGRFDTAATELTAGILMFLLPGAFALSAYTVVVRGYYAMQNTFFPAVFGTVAVSLSLPIYWYGMQWFEAQGIALAISLSGFFQVLLLYILWNRKTGNKESLIVYHFYIKIIVMSSLLGIFLEALKRKVFPFMDSPDLLRSAVVFLVIGGMYTLLIIGAGYLGKVQEINDVLARMIRKRPG